MIVEHVPHGKWPRPTPTNVERYAAWSSLYARVTNQVPTRNINYPIGGKK